MSCVSLSAIKSCGEPAPALTSSPVPLSVTAEPGDTQCSRATLFGLPGVCVLSVARQTVKPGVQARVKPAFCTQQGCLGVWVAGVAGVAVVVNGPYRGWVRGSEELALRETNYCSARLEAST